MYPGCTIFLKPKHGSLTPFRGHLMIIFTTRAQYLYFNLFLNKNAPFYTFTWMYKNTLFSTWMCYYLFNILIFYLHIVFLVSCTLVSLFLTLCTYFIIINFTMPSCVLCSRTRNAKSVSDNITFHKYVYNNILFLLKQLNF